MQNKEQLVKDLTAKDEKKAFDAACSIIDNADIEAFQILSAKSEFLFDFVKNNVSKRLSKAVNENNYKNIFSLLKIYCPDFEEVIVSSLAKYANEELTDEMFELLESGTDEQKAYAAKYFSYIPDTIAADILTDYAFSDNEAIAFNAAKALGAMNIDTAYKKALELLEDSDDFTVLKAVKFLVAYEDKNAVNNILKAMEKSSMSENIAGEIPYLESLMELLNQNEVKSYVLLCIDNILSGLGEILPLSQIFCFEIFEVLEFLISYNAKNKNPQASVILLKALSKFEMLAQNDEYTFDEDKNTKQEINDIYNLLKKQQEYFWNAQKNLVKNELDTNIKPFARISSALRIIAEYKLHQAQQEVENLLESSDEILICEATSTLKQLNNLEGVDKNAILSKIQDENKKAIIQSLFL